MEYHPILGNRLVVIKTNIKRVEVKYRIIKLHEQKGGYANSHIKKKDRLQNFDESGINAAKIRIQEIRVKQKMKNTFHFVESHLLLHNLHINITSQN